MVVAAGNNKHDHRQRRARSIGHCHEASHTTDPIPQGNKC
jgi:hypothetical protein